MRNTVFELNEKNEMSSETLLNPIKIGISSCLMGEEVRFNKGHKHSKYCSTTLSHYFDFISVCPEMGIGMGTPRKPIRLIGSSKDASIYETQAVSVAEDKANYTESLKSYAAEKAKLLSDVSGFIFMHGSPSCGTRNVKVYSEKGGPLTKGQGVFSREFSRHNPLIPTEDEGRLNDPIILENFISRVYFFHEWQQLSTQLSAKALIAFHSKHKYLLLSHSQQGYRQLGRLLSNFKSADLHETANTYISLAMDTLKQFANRKNHTNVLMHLQGYLSNFLNKTNKQELCRVVDEYRQGIVPLVVPMTLLQHHLNNHYTANDYPCLQSYLSPYPAELGLRNRI